jgi:hypothetical protein
MRITRKSFSLKFLVNDRPIFGPVRSFDKN